MIAWLSAGASGRDEAGNEATHLHLVGVDEDGLINYHARFEAGSFDSAYPGTGKAAAAGEGADFAGCGLVLAAFLRAADAFDVETLD